MPVSEPKIRANMLLGLRELLASYAVDASRVLSDASIPQTVGVRHDVGISLNKYARLLELSARRTHQECFGLRFANAFPRGGMHALGFLLLNAPDLRTSLQCLCRYIHLQADAIGFTLHESGGYARLAITIEPSFTAPRRQLLEFTAALIVIRLRNEYGGDWVPFRAEFSYREPRCRADYERLFGKRLQFEAAETALTFHATALRKTSVAADEKLFALLKEVVETEIAKLRAEQRQDRDVVFRLQDAIAEGLKVGEASLEQAASRIGLKPRQLQIALKRHATTFEDELARTRRSLAERYLRQTSLSLTEIALLLGFSEHSAFTRAANGWFGMPPSRWRKRARSDADEA